MATPILPVAQISKHIPYDPVPMSLLTNSLNQRLRQNWSDTFWPSFLIQVVLPTVLTIILFVAATLVFILPTIEQISLDRKKEMIRELTTSAWNILAKFEHDEQNGLLSRQEAQRRAIEQIRNLHYGHGMKDYFWVNDMFPRMIIHPYRTDLIGKDLSQYTDPTGKKVFLEMVKTVNRSGSGYVEYRWQWMDDKNHIVPKISFVKGFPPWGWIIGTGVYIEDIKAEIARITQQLMVMISIILAIISLLLVSIVFYSFRTEKRRRSAEEGLLNSKEMYQALVESVRVGVFTGDGQRVHYSNQNIQNLLEYTEREFQELSLADIFEDDPVSNPMFQIKTLLTGIETIDRFETRLVTKSGSIVSVFLSIAETTLEGKPGFIAVATDISPHGDARKALSVEHRFRSMADHLNVGVFRVQFETEELFVKKAPLTLRILGGKIKQGELSAPVLHLEIQPEDRKRISQKLFNQDESLISEIVTFFKQDGSSFIGAISGMIIRNHPGQPDYFDGIVVDVTDVKQKEKSQDKLLSEMQTALTFLGHPISKLDLLPVSQCDLTTSARQVIEMMNQLDTDVLLVTDEQQRPIGVITDGDIRKRAASRKVLKKLVALDIMTPQIVSLPTSATVIEAGIHLRQKQVTHIFVSDAQGKMEGVLRPESLTTIQKYSPVVLLQEIQTANTPEIIIQKNRIFPFMVSVFINSGAKAQFINNLITLNTDAVTTRFIEFAIAELGPPPVKFSFLIFGSVGRQEQTLNSDQDNAIIYEDVSENESEEVKAYFLKLGSKVCGWLDLAGYDFCPGNYMAQNPKWCQPVSNWKHYFNDWVCKSESTDLLQTKIFFDFRSAYGNVELVNDLRSHLNHVIEKTPRFFQMLARNILKVTPPLGFFGTFVVESKGDQKKAFDIKNAMMPIVDYARIYALKHRIDTPSTFERLDHLLELKILEPQNHQELIQAYSYLMQIRLKNQSDSISEGSRNINNYISPKSLTFIEQKILKEIFTQTKYFQTNLSYHFTGTMDGI